MSIQQDRLTENDIETAAGREQSSAGTVEENLMSFEASEDRIVVGVYAKSDNETTAEVSFSSQMLTDTQATDEVSSGVLHLSNSTNTSYWAQYGINGPEWHAGEELNVHTDNASADPALIIVIIAYIPVGDFLRERLRNR